MLYIAEKTCSGYAGCTLNFERTKCIETDESPSNTENL